MTITFMSDTIRGHHIAIKQEKFSPSYHVIDYDTRAQRTDSDRIYSTMQKAKTRYNALCRKYK